MHRMEHWRFCDALRLGVATCICIMKQPLLLCHGMSSTLTMLKTGWSHCLYIYRTENLNSLNVSIFEWPAPTKFNMVI